MSIFSRKEEAPVETAASRKIAKSIEELDAALQKDIESRDNMGLWSSRLGTTALVVGALFLLTPIKVPLVLGIGAIAGVGYGIMRMLRQECDDNIAKKLESKAKLELVEEAARAVGKPVGPSAANTPKISGEYNAKSDPEAERIAAIEERIKALQDELEGKPVVLDKPKTIISRLGL